MDRLLAYRWPGNVRERENVLEHAVILANGPTLEIEADVLPRAAAEPRPPAADNGTPRDVERSHILAVLRQTSWVIDGPKGAAQILGLHPNTLRSRLKKMGISRAAHEIS